MHHACMMYFIFFLSIWKVFEGLREERLNVIVKWVPIIQCIFSFTIIILWTSKADIKLFPLCFNYKRFTVKTLVFMVLFLNLVSWGYIFVVSSLWEQYSLKNNILLDIIYSLKKNQILYENFCFLFSNQNFYSNLWSLKKTKNLKWR